MSTLSTNCESQQSPHGNVGTEKEMDLILYGVDFLPDDNCSQGPGGMPSFAGSPKSHINGGMSVLLIHLKCDNKIKIKPYC